MGSGKSTQAKLLADKLNLCFLRTGDVLREIAKKDTPKGREVKESLDKGLMVDDAIVANLIKERLSQDDAKNGFVSDSYPRHLVQIDYFDPNLDVIFFLNISPDRAKERLLARGREDDREELIDFRHQTQGEKIIELVDFYKGKIPVHYINGEQEVEKVHQEILSYLK